MTRGAVAQLRSVNQSRVLQSTAANVAVLYDSYWWRTPPPGRSQTHCERHAESHGWIGPWRWDGLDIDDPATTPLPDGVDQIDPVAIAEVLAGRRPVPLNRAERHAAVDELHHRGFSARQIAERIGISDRTVCRYISPGRAGV